MSTVEHLCWWALTSCIFYNREQLAEDGAELPANELCKQHGKKTSLQNRALTEISSRPSSVNSPDSYTKALRRRSSTGSIFSRQRSSSFKTEAQLRALQNPQLRALQNPHYMVIFVYFPSYLRMAMQSPSFLTILLSS